MPSSSQKHIEDSNGYTFDLGRGGEVQNLVVLEDGIPGPFIPIQSALGRRDDSIGKNGNLDLRDEREEAKDLLHEAGVFSVGQQAGLEEVEIGKGVVPQSFGRLSLHSQVHEFGGRIDAFGAHMREDSRSKFLRQTRGVQDQSFVDESESRLAELDPRSQEIEHRIDPLPAHLSLDEPLVDCVRALNNSELGILPEGLCFSARLSDAEEDL